MLALSYAVVRILHLTLYAYAAGDDGPPRRQIAKTAVGMVLGSALTVTGAVVGGPAQTWFWLAGIGVDAAITTCWAVRSSGGGSAAA